MLLAGLSMPALVQSRYLDVLAANTMAQAFSPNMRPGANRLRAALLDPAEADLHADWEKSTATAVAQLRATMGAESDDPRMVELVGELSMKSERFRQLWARQDVVRPAGGLARLHHPDVGNLALHREKLTIAGTDGQVLVIYHAEPETASADALALLGSIAMTNSPSPREESVPRDQRAEHRALALPCPPRPAVLGRLPAPQTHARRQEVLPRDRGRVHTQLRHLRHHRLRRPDPVPLHPGSRITVRGDARL